MRKINGAVGGVNAILFTLFVAQLGVASVTNPLPYQVFEVGQASVDIAWEPVKGADTYEQVTLYNDRVFDSAAAINGVAGSLSMTDMPGYYTVFVRGATASGKGPWSDPLTFIVKGTMVPADGSILSTAPRVFKWTRIAPATRYRLKLAEYDDASGKYIAKLRAWIQQPPSGKPRWRPLESLQSGRFRWSITDYSGQNPGATFVAYFTVSEGVEPTRDEFLVVDLSGGPTAGSYPVTYMDQAPAGGWPDVYKASKLVMRKIPAGVFAMGSPASELGRFPIETQHTVTLTKGFYIGVFEITQRQWELVMGARPSYFNNHTYYASRPVKGVSYDDIRGSSAGAGWPGNNSVDAASFMGKLRAKTGLSTFDLPTESQWEYACRAGTTTALNSGKDLANQDQDANMAETGRYRYNGGSDYVQNGDPSVGSAKAGSYLCNAWGLYDMHGNVGEWCLDFDGPYPGATSNPRGSESGSDRVLRGGGWNYYGPVNYLADSYDEFYCANLCRSAYRMAHYPSYRNWQVGFRAVMNLP